ASRQLRPLIAPGFVGLSSDIRFMCRRPSLPRKNVKSRTSNPVAVVDAVMDVAQSSTPLNESGTTAPVRRDLSGLMSQRPADVLNPYRDGSKREYIYGRNHVYSNATIENRASLRLLEQLAYFDDFNSSSL